MPAMILTIALASLLGGIVMGLNASVSAVRIGAPLLAALTVAASVAAMRGRRQLVPVVLLGGAAGMGLLAWHMSGLPSTIPMRSLHVAAVLCWGVVLLAGLLKAVRLLDWSHGLLLGYSVAVSLLIADALMPPPPAPQQTVWQVTTRPDPDTGFRYLPNSTAWNVYPDNPRGYFDQTKPTRDNWMVETHGGSEATLEFVEAVNGDLLRITIPKLVERQAWHVKLQQAPLSVTAGTSYTVSFEARSDAPRPVGCAIGQNHEPWEALGKYHEFEVGPEWGRFECPITASASDTKARLFFDLAKSDATLEMQNVVIMDQSGQPVSPPARAPQFVVNYRFNSLGLRGPDRAIPAPPGTFRIVTLGDSYAMGVGVKDDDTVAAQLERRLNAAAAASGDKTVYEVINDGVSGYDTRQERMSYEKHSSKYEPQVVLLLMVFNDDLNYNDDLRKGLLTASGAGRLFNVWGRVESVRESRVYDYSGSLYQVRQLNEAVKRRGARLAVAVFRNATSAPWMKLVEDATTGLKGTGIPLLDLGPALLDGSAIRPELAVHAVDGHPNEIAHGIAAEALERFLRAERLIK